jgi:hypothetical protein
VLAQWTDPFGIDVGHQHLWNKKINEPVEGLEIQNQENHVCISKPIPRSLYCKGETFLKQASVRVVMVSGPIFTVTF